MKVEGPGPVRTGTVTAKRRAGKKNDESFAPELRVDDSSVIPVGGTVPLTAVDALLPLQEVADATSEQSRAVRHGHDLLDHLDDIRIGLLTGSIPRAKLQRLLNMVEARRDQVVDPRIAATLDEIELRAKVELAKLQMLP